MIVKVINEWFFPLCFSCRQTKQIKKIVICQSLLNYANEIVIANYANEIVIAHLQFQCSLIYVYNHISYVYCNFLVHGYRVCKHIYIVPRMILNTPIVRLSCVRGVVDTLISFVATYCSSHWILLSFSHPFHSFHWMLNLHSPLEYCLLLYYQLCTNFQGLFSHALFMGLMAKSLLF